MNIEAGIRNHTHGIIIDHGIYSTDSLTRSLDPDLILNKTWQWTSTITPVETINVNDPENYTIHLTSKGTVKLRLDCNKGFGNFEVSQGRLSFGVISSTKMACPDTLDMVFMRDLSRVISFFIAGNNLYLELPYDSGTMHFRLSPE